MSNIGSEKGFVNYQDGRLYLTQRRYAVQATRVQGTNAVVNTLLSIDTEPLIIRGTLSDQREIPNYIYNEIKTSSDKLTYEHNWGKNDLIMIDNKRFMHGRRPIVKDDLRDIVIIQSQRVSFGCGSTTRNPINRTTIGRF